MPMFIRKPSTPIEAIQYKGDNITELITFTDEAVKFDDTLLRWVLWTDPKNPLSKVVIYSDDWITKDVNGNPYPIKDDVFKKLYEPVKKKKGGETSEDKPE